MSAPIHVVRACVWDRSAGDRPWIRSIYVFSISNTSINIYTYLMIWPKTKNHNFYQNFGYLWRKIIIANKAIRILIPIASSYLCETGFSQDWIPEKEMRIALSKFTPRFNTTNYFKIKRPRGPKKVENHCLALNSIICL